MMNLQNIIKTHEYQKKQLLKNCKDFMKLQNKKQSYFAQRYNDDPEYRKNHLQYINTRVPCETCCIQVPRVNISKHSKTKKHIHNLELMAKKSEEIELRESVWKLHKIQILNDLKSRVQCTGSKFNKSPAQLNEIFELMAR